MGELEEIRRRAAERRDDSDVDIAMLGRGEMEGMWKEAEADLDRVIALAENTQLWADQTVQNAKRVADGIQRERDQARADVLALRQLATLDEVGNSWVRKLMNDTALYEKYRRGGPDGAAEG